MILENFLLIATLVLAAGVILVGCFVGVRTYLRYRGKMLITCPETGKAAAVKVDATQAVRESLVGHAKIRLEECSRWPERQNCGQECLSQVEADPEKCLVWTTVAKWYEGKSCAYCHKPFGEIHWHDHRPALVGPAGKSVQWNEIRAERLPEFFATHLPVCWDCHIAETFRHEHPELVVDRTWKRGAMGEVIPEHRPEK
ncbi:MAG: hypothetical protein LAN84_05890 [Acidobacteriia bacterium]|nr:hypothetical protein [Terriglobia bacterium]